MIMANSHINYDYIVRCLLIINTMLRGKTMIEIMRFWEDTSPSTC